MMALGIMGPGEADTNVEGKDQGISDGASKGESVQKTLELLSANGDTSRFAGLTVLKALLDSNEDLQKNSKLMAQFWTAIPARFLDRLLKAGASAKKSKQEAESMAELAIGVLHAFVRLIPSTTKEDEKFIGRAEGLMAALAWSPNQSVPQILQILVTLASTQKGSLALLNAMSWCKLLEAVPGNSLALDVVGYTFLTAASQTVEQLLFWDKLDSTLSTLAVPFANTRDPVQFFDYLDQILTASPARENNCSPSWLAPIVKSIQTASLSRQVASVPKTRQAMVLLTATLCRLYPLQVSQLLFGEPEPEPEQRIPSDSKPVSYLFVKLLLIDIRSTVPSLLALLNSPEYPSTSARIAGSYDVVSSFIGYLVQSVGNEEPFDASIPFSIPSSLSPSLLLQLRVDISEVMSLTIENLRDRFDASLAGAAGLDPSARLHSSGPSNPTLAIAWESSNGGMNDDPLTLSQLRTLALWLREDDNGTLRREAAGIMDVILHLYPSDRSFDFRSPVLIALEGIVAVPEGVEAFLRYEGWETLDEALRVLLLSPGRDSSLGVAIVRVLLGIVEAEETGPAKEEWMDVVRMASATSPSRLYDSFSFEIAVGQLAVEIIIRSPFGVRKRNQRAVTDLQNWAKDVKVNFGSFTTEEEKEGLWEILQALEDLRDS